MSIEHGNQEGDGTQGWGGDPYAPTVQVPMSMPVNGPLRSPVAAALLNLTGLGLGYAYLRRWWRTALYAAGSVLLVVVAFATDAASLAWLWRAVAVVWLGWMALDGTRLARRGPRLEGIRQQLVPAAAGVALVVTVVAGYLVYGAAGRSVYAEGVAAQGRADCANAIRKFDLVTGPYELTLSRDVPAAAQNRAQCEAFTSASRAEAKGDYADAVGRYRDYRRVYPATLLIPFAHENLERTYASWARSLRAARDYPGAIHVYRDLLAESGSEPGATQVRGDLAATYFEQADAAGSSLPSASDGARVGQARAAVDTLLVIQREFGDTPTAARVPQALSDTYTAAVTPFTQQRFCDALPVLDYFVTLPDAETAGVVGAANANRAQAMLECGLAKYRTGDYARAIDQLDKLATTYPDDPGTAQARSAIIAAEVARQKDGPAPGLPAPLGDNSPGDIAVTFYNDNPLEVHVLITEPTAHDITVPGCPGCAPSYLTATEACPTLRGKPSVTLRLQPGTYDFLGSYTSGTPRVQTRTFERGFFYSECAYIGPDQ